MSSVRRVLLWGIGMYGVYCLDNGVICLELWCLEDMMFKILIVCDVQFGDVEVFCEMILVVYVQYMEMMKVEDFDFYQCYIELMLCKVVELVEVGDGLFEQFVVVCDVDVVGIVLFYLLGSDIYKIEDLKVGNYLEVCFFVVLLVLCGLGVGMLFMEECIV